MTGGLFHFPGAIDTAGRPPRSTAFPFARWLAPATRHEAGGGLGAKFPRALVSEIMGIDTPVEEVVRDRRRQDGAPDGRPAHGQPHRPPGRAAQGGGVQEPDRLEHRSGGSGQGSQEGSPFGDQPRQHHAVRHPPLASPAILLAPLRLLPAGATVAGRDSHPLGYSAFPRRTPKTKATTQHGANRLAAVGLAALTVVPQRRAREVRLGVLGGDREPDGTFAFTWPIWRDPISLAAIRTLLGHPRLDDLATSLELSIVECRRARRNAFGKYMTFLPS